MMSVLLQAVEEKLKEALPTLADVRVGIQPDGRPPASAGQWYAAIYPISEQNNDSNPIGMALEYDFGVSLTYRMAYAPRDRQGSEMTVANTGFLSRAGTIRDKLHGSWPIITLANQKLVNLAGGADVYQFNQVPVYRRMSIGLKPPDWVWHYDETGVPTVLVAELFFGGCLRTINLLGQ